MGMQHEDMAMAKHHHRGEIQDPRTTSNLGCCRQRYRRCRRRIQTRGWTSLLLLDDRLCNSKNDHNNNNNNHNNNNKSKTRNDTTTIKTTSSTTFLYNSEKTQ